VALLRDSELEVVEDERQVSGKRGGVRERRHCRPHETDRDRIHMAPRDTSSWSTTLEALASSVTPGASLSRHER
jgi:hypothetical protein